MKKIVIPLSIFFCMIHLSCRQDPGPIKKSMSDDAMAFINIVVAIESTGLGGTPPTAIAAAAVAAIWAADISVQEGRLVANPNATYVKQNGIYIPSFTRLDIEINPFEEEGDLHNKAVDLIVKKGNLEDLHDKFMNQDREAMDEFFQLSPHLQDANIRELALNAYVAWEAPTEIKDKLIKLSEAQNLSEAVSQLPLSENGKAIVTEVYNTCQNYFINDANFEQVAGFLNEKIKSLLNKGKDATPEDIKLARTFTLYKHSYYYWHIN